MSRRYSILENKLRGYLEEMVRRTMWLHLSDCDTIDPEEIIKSAFQPLLAGLERMRETTPEDIYRNYDAYESSHIHVCFPTRRWTTCELIGPNMNYRPVPWSSYKEQLYTKPDKNQDQWMPGCIVLGIHIPFNLPVKRSWNIEHNHMVDKYNHHVVMTPQRMGKYDWHTVLDEMTKLHDLVVMLNFFRGYGNAIAKHCTTEGITKRIWPEVEAFCPAAVQDKPSQYPRDFKQNVLTDFGGQCVSVASMQAQLKSIADAILASQLMPEVDTYLQGDYKVTSIETACLNPDTFPMEQYGYLPY